MDTTIVLAVATGLAVLLALWLLARDRRHRRAVDEALRRIGGAPRRRRRRVPALEAGLDRVERGTAQAQRERARLAGAVQAAPLGIVITDDDGVILTTNPAAGRYLGARLGEAVAEVRIREAIEKAVLDRSPVEMSIDLYTPVRTALEVTAIPLDFGIESAGCVAFVADVSEERRVSAMRRDFIANVGHELKTPLGALSVLAETLSSSLDDPTTSARLAERLQSESMRLSRLVENILDLSQAEALSSPDEPVVLADVVREVVETHADRAREAGVTLAADDLDSSVRVAGDARQLGVLVTNLVENAIKYSFAGSGEPPTVEASVARSGEEAIIEVRDEGIGVADAHIDRIFERFYRVDRARSRDTGGTGLGLSIVRHIARNHRGDVSVESVEGEGSTFRVSLPLWRKRR